MEHVKAREAAAASASDPSLVDQVSGQIGTEATSKDTLNQDHGAATEHWRALLAVHPAAELFPLMADTDPAGLKELAENIKANGLIDPIVIWKDENDDKLFLLDGRNRLDAMVLAGILGVDALGILFNVETGFPVYPVELFSQKPCARGGDPYEIAIGLNVHRRHLTAALKNDLIAAVLKAKSELSNRQIGEITKTDKKKVGAVRTKMEATGVISPVEKRTGKDNKAHPAKAKKKKSPPITVPPAPIEVGINTGPEANPASAAVSIISEVERDWNSAKRAFEALTSHTRAQVASVVLPVEAALITEFANFFTELANLTTRAGREGSS